MKLTHGIVSQKLRPLAPDAHKGTQGHLLVVGGSYGKIGAVCLASKTALRSGCGLVTVFLPGCGYTIIQSVLPEAMAITDADQRQITAIATDLEPDAVAMGPGMGTAEPTQKALHDFLSKNKKPLVLDADALNILSRHRDWLGFLPNNTILTPHPKELERLLGEKADTNLSNVQRFCQTYKVIVVAKNAPTHIVTEDAVFENTTGNAALATGGSGDSLTGVIGSLLAQGYDAPDAAKIGVYVHGLSADIGIENGSARAFIAGDIAENLGKAFKRIGG